MRGGERKKMAYTKWRKKKELTLKQLQEVGIDEIDAKEVGDEIYVDTTEEVSKLNPHSLVKAKAKCAFTVHGRLYIEQFEGWVNGYGTFYCTEQELEKHI